MKTHDEMVAEWMKDPAFKMEYDALEADFFLFDELLKARHAAGLTQADVVSEDAKDDPKVFGEKRVWEGR